MLGSILLLCCATYNKDMAYCNLDGDNGSVLGASSLSTEAGVQGQYGQSSIATTLDLHLRRAALRERSGSRQLGRPRGYVFEPRLPDMTTARSRVSRMKRV